MLVSIGLQTIPSIGEKPWNIIIEDYLFYTLSFVTFFYVFYFFISEKHLSRKKIILLIISGLLFTIIVTVPISYLYIYLLMQNVIEMTGKKFFLNFGKYYISFFETNFMFAVSGSLLKTALLWYENTMKQKEAEKQLVSGELSLLRSQLNPGFLLNTLTYIRALIGTKPDKAIYCIENLSEIMSYMLYETSADKVSLDNEINYIKNYLNLQRVRFRPEYIQFEVTGVTAGAEVPPLLFMPFLENAFNKWNDPGENPEIFISLSVKEDILLFEVKKYRRDTAGNIKNEDEFKFDTLKRFLDLQFRENYSLEKADENNKTTICFKLSVF